MLNCSPEAIERLHKVQIYPIVLFIRHKSPKQIREVKDTRFLPEKVSNKVAKELFELHQEYEHKYKLHFSGTDWMLQNKALLNSCALYWLLINCIFAVNVAYTADMV